MAQLNELISLTRRFLPYLNGVRVHWAHIAALMVLSPLLSAALLWAVKVLIDDVFVGRAFDQLPVLISIYVAISFAKLTCTYLSTRLDATLTTKVAQAVRVDLYRHLISLSPGSVKNKTGDLLSRLSGDVESVEYFIYSGPLGLCANVLRTAIFISVLVSLSWKLTACAMIIAPLFACAGLFFAPTIRRVSRIARRRSASCASLAEERLNATVTIQANTAEEFEHQAYRRRCDAARKAEIHVEVVQAWSSAVIETVAVVGGLLVILLGAMEIHSGAMTVGTLMAFLGSIGSLYGPVSSLAKTPGRFQRAAARVVRVQELLDAANVVAERPAAPALIAPKGLLEFDDVVFGYTKPHRILDGISLRIEPGEKVAIVGASGSGKSSLMKLAIRLHDPWQGSVKIDGVDLRAVTLRSVRQAVSIVLQDSYLFNGTIAENIRYAQELASFTEVESAGLAAQVSDFAQATRSGYDASVGASGKWLSGGQRQRVAIARALLRDSPILILDEATAAVDSETEDKVQSAIDQFAGKTMLIIGHRLSSIRHADRLIVMENGRIVGVGTPSGLLKGNSRCRSLFSAQLVSGEMAA